MKNLSTKTLAELVEIYNTHADKAVRKFRDKATAVKRVLEVLPRSRGRGRPARHGDDAVIRVMVESNPKRPNSMSYEWFKLYADGMTVGAALERGVRRAWLNWDEKHGYIEIQS